MQVMQLLWPGAMAAQAVHVVAKLGIADLLGSDPKTASELATEANVHVPSLARFLRAITSLGFFAEDADGRFTHTPLSETLRRDHQDSIRRWALMLGAGFVWQPCGRLYESIQSGRCAFDRVFGEPFFQYLATHPDDAAVFNAAMSSMPSYITSVVDAYDYSQFGRIVDVGGGHGVLLQGILSRHPDVRAVLFDLPPVVEGAAELRRSPAGARCDIVGGDVFEGVPEGADAYLLSGIIHDWPDDAALKILRNCRRAIRQDGTLLLFETVLTPSASTEPQQALMDLMMMVLTSGKERSESDFRALLRDAGFSLTRVIPTQGASILEGRPV
jgi:SAM-dependent methyltransferase